MTLIKSLPRAKVEELVTQAWLENLRGQSDEKLQSLVTGAIKHGLLNVDAIQNTKRNSFMTLPLNVTPSPLPDSPGVLGLMQP